MFLAFILFGGIADLFLSAMLWLILDDEIAPTIYIDGNRAYSVTDVIKTSHVSINIDCQDEEKGTETRDT